MQSSLLGSPVSLAFWSPEWLMGDDPVQVKFDCKEVDFSAKTAVLYTFRLITLKTIIDSEKSSIDTNRKSTMAFRTTKVVRHP